MAAGTLWLFLIGLLVYPNRSSFANSFPEFLRFSQAVLANSKEAWIIFLPVVSYIVGISLQHLSSYGGRLLANFARRLVRRGRSLSRITPVTELSWADKALRRSFMGSGQVRQVVSLYSAEAIGRADLVKRKLLPAEISLYFPTTAVLNDGEATLLKLSDTKPKQFDLIDRLQAEAQFRLAIATPLSLICVVLTSENWLAAVGLILTGLLFWQGLQHHRKSNELIWTAAYLGWADPPILTAAKDSLDAWRQRPTPPVGESYPSNEEEWLTNFAWQSGMNPQVINDIQSEFWQRHPH